MFTEHADIERKLVWIEGLTNIAKIVGGTNHMLALDHKGNVFAWGAGEQSQLGRRIVERHRGNARTPREFGLPRGKIVDIFSGDFHSFALDKTGKVYTWGLNGFGQTGIPIRSETDEEDEDTKAQKAKGKGKKNDEKEGDDSTIITPALVTSLSDFKIKEIAAGAHHSIAATEDGKLLAWGRCDGSQCFIKMDDFPSESFVWKKPPSKRLQATDAEGNILRDANGWPLWINDDSAPAMRKALIAPTVVPGESLVPLELYVY